MACREHAKAPGLMQDGVVLVRPQHDPIQRRDPGAPRNRLGREELVDGARSIPPPPLRLGNEAEGRV